MLFRATDRNGDGRISFDELEAALRRRPELLRKMTLSEAIWLAPNEDLLDWIDTPNKAKAQRAWLPRGHWLPGAFVTLWALSNLAICAVSLRLGAPPGPRLWMQLGRTPGLALDFNGALILIPMMRRLLTRVRASFLGRVIPVDHAIAFHRLLGHSLFVLGLGHATCFTVAYAGGHSRQSLTELLFTTGKGLTGLSLLAVLSVMWVFSLAFIRRTKHFELFYFTHLLYLAWLALAIAHAPSFLLWAGVPLLGFAFEQMWRISRRANASRVAACTPLRSAVTHLELERPNGFDFAPADYVFLRIPAIAAHEWHPFTLSSAPERATLSVHIRSLGDWSSALRRAVEENIQPALTVQRRRPIRISERSHL